MIMLQEDANTATLGRVTASSNNKMKCSKATLTDRVSFTSVVTDVSSRFF